MGEPIFDCRDDNDLKDEGEEEVLPIAKLNDKLREAPTEFRTRIEACLNAIRCHVRQSSADCRFGDHEVCLGEAAKGQESSPVVRYECKIESILCRLSDDNNNNNQNDDDCRSKEKICLLTAGVNDEAQVTATSSDFSDVVAASTTTTTSRPQDQDIKSTTATLPSSATNKIKANSETSSDFVASSTQTPTTTPKRLEEDVKQTTENRPTFTTGKSTTTAAATTTTTTTTLGRKEEDAISSTTLSSTPVTNSIANGLRDDEEPEPPLIISNDDGAKVPQQEKPRDDDDDDDDEIDEKKKKVDVSFYESSPKTTIRLSNCLEGLQCEFEDNPECLGLHEKCNEGLDVAALPVKIRLKLSECQIADIICHLNREGDCERKFVECADIVVPNSVSIGAKEPGIINEDEKSDSFDPFLHLLGIDGGGQTGGSLIDNLTNNVLDTLQETLPGGIEVTPINASVPLEVLLAQNDTLPIFQDIHIIINDDVEDNSTGMVAVVDVNGTKVRVDLSDVNVVFSPDGLRIGHDNDNNNMGENEEEENLHEAIVENFAEVATICPTCDHDDIEEEEEHSSVGMVAMVNVNGTQVQVDLSDVNVVLPPQSGQNSTGLHQAIVDNFAQVASICTTCHKEEDDDDEMVKSTISPSLDSVVIYPSSADLQFRLAVCLKGIECLEERPCFLAQMKCLGREKSSLYNGEERIAISECVVENYLCQLGGNSTACKVNLDGCLSRVTLTPSTQEAVMKEKAEESVDAVVEKVSQMVEEEPQTALNPLKISADPKLNSPLILLDVDDMEISVAIPALPAEDRDNVVVDLNIDIPMKEPLKTQVDKIALKEEILIGLLAEEDFEKSVNDDDNDNDDDKKGDSNVVIVQNAEQEEEEEVLTEDSRVENDEDKKADDKEKQEEKNTNGNVGGFTKTSSDHESQEEDGKNSDRNDNHSNQPDEIIEKPKVANNEGNESNINPLNEENDDDYDDDDEMKEKIKPDQEILTENENEKDEEYDSIRNNEQPDKIIEKPIVANNEADESNGKSDDDDDEMKEKINSDHEIQTENEEDDDDNDPNRNNDNSGQQFLDSVIDEIVEIVGEMPELKKKPLRLSIDPSLESPLVLLDHEEAVINVAVPPTTDNDSQKVTKVVRIEVPIPFIPQKTRPTAYEVDKIALKEEILIALQVAVDEQKQKPAVSIEMGQTKKNTQPDTLVDDNKAESPQDESINTSSSSDDDNESHADRDDDDDIANNNDNSSGVSNQQIEPEAIQPHKENSFQVKDDDDESVGISHDGGGSNDHENNEEKDKIINSNDALTKLSSEEEDNEYDIDRVISEVSRLVTDDPAFGMRPLKLFLNPKLRSPLVLVDHEESSINAALPVDHDDEPAEVLINIPLLPLKTRPGEAAVRVDEIALKEEILIALLEHENVQEIPIRASSPLTNDGDEDNENKAQVKLPEHRVNAENVDQVIEEVSEIVQNDPNFGLQPLVLFLNPKLRSPFVLVDKDEGSIKAAIPVKDTAAAKIAINIPLLPLKTRPSTVAVDKIALKEEILIALLESETPDDEESPISVKTNNEPQNAPDVIEILLNKQNFEDDHSSKSPNERVSPEYVDQVIEEVSQIVQDNPDFGEQPLRLFLNPKLRSPLVLIDHEETAIKVAVPAKDATGSEILVDIPVLPLKTRPNTVIVDKIALKEEILIALLEGNKPTSNQSDNFKEDAAVPNEENLAITLNKQDIANEDDQETPEKKVPNEANDEETTKTERISPENIDRVVEEISDIVEDDPDLGQQPLKLFLNPKLRAPLVLIDHEEIAIKAAIPVKGDEGGEILVNIPLLPLKTRPSTVKVDKIALKEEILIALLEETPKDKIVATNIVPKEEDKILVTEDDTLSSQPNKVEEEKPTLPNEENLEITLKTQNIGEDKPTNKLPNERYSPENIDQIVEEVSNIVERDPNFGRQPLTLFLNPKLRSPLVLVDDEETAIKAVIPVNDDSKSELSVDIPVLPLKTRPSTIIVDKIALKEEILIALLEQEKPEVKASDTIKSGENVPPPESNEELIDEANPKLPEKQLSAVDEVVAEVTQIIKNDPEFAFKPLRVTLNPRLRSPLILLDEDEGSIVAAIPSKAGSKSKKLSIKIPLLPQKTRPTNNVDVDELALKEELLIALLYAGDEIDTKDGRFPTSNDDQTDAVNPKLPQKQLSAVDEVVAEVSQIIKDDPDYASKPLQLTLNPRLRSPLILLDRDQGSIVAAIPSKAGSKSKKLSLKIPTLPQKTRPTNNIEVDELALKEELLIALLLADEENSDDEILSNKSSGNNPPTKAGDKNVEQSEDSDDESQQSVADNQDENENKDVATGNIGDGGHMESAGVDQEIILDNQQDNDKEDIHLGSQMTSSANKDNSMKDNVPIKEENQGMVPSIKEKKPNNVNKSEEDEVDLTKGENPTKLDLDDNSNVSSDKEEGHQNSDNSNDSEQTGNEDFNAGNNSNNNNLTIFFDMRNSSSNSMIPFAVLEGIANVVLNHFDSGVDFIIVPIQEKSDLMEFTGEDQHHLLSEEPNDESVFVFGEAVELKGHSADHAVILTMDDLKAIERKPERKKEILKRLRKLLSQMAMDSMHMHTHDDEDDDGIQDQVVKVLSDKIAEVALDNRNNDGEIEIQGNKDENTIVVSAGEEVSIIPSPIQVHQDDKVTVQLDSVGLLQEEIREKIDPLFSDKVEDQNEELILDEVVNALSEQVADGVSEGPVKINGNKDDNTLTITTGDAQTTMDSPIKVEHSDQVVIDSDSNKPIEEEIKEKITPMFDKAEDEEKVVGMNEVIKLISDKILEGASGAPVEVEGNKEDNTIIVTTGQAVSEISSPVKVHQNEKVILEVETTELAKKTIEQKLKPLFKEDDQVVTDGMKEVIKVLSEKIAALPLDGPIEIKGNKEENIIIVNSGEEVSVIPSPIQVHHNNQVTVQVDNGEIHPKEIEEKLKPLFEENEDDQVVTDGMSEVIKVLSEKIADLPIDGSIEIKGNKEENTIIVNAGEEILMIPSPIQVHRNDQVTVQVDSGEMHPNEIEEKLKPLFEENEDDHSDNDGMGEVIKVLSEKIAEMNPDTPVEIKGNNEENTITVTSGNEVSVIPSPINVKQNDQVTVQVQNGSLLPEEIEEKLKPLFSEKADSHTDNDDMSEVIKILSEKIAEMNADKPVEVKGNKEENTITVTSGNEISVIQSPINVKQNDQVTVEAESGEIISDNIKEKLKPLFNEVENGDIEVMSIPQFGFTVKAATERPISTTTTPQDTNQGSNTIITQDPTSATQSTKAPSSLQTDENSVTSHTSTNSGSNPIQSSAQGNNNNLNSGSQSQSTTSVVIPSDGNNEDQGQSLGIIERIRNIVLGLVASTVTGLMAQTFSGGNAPPVQPPIPPGLFGPARKEDIFINTDDLKLPPSSPSGSDSTNVFFDGHVLNITLPVKPGEVERYDNRTELQQEVEGVVQGILRNAFRPQQDDEEAPPKLKVVVTKGDEANQLIINAQADDDQDRLIPSFNSRLPPRARPRPTPRPFGGQQRPQVPFGGQQRPQFPLGGQQRPPQQRPPQPNNEPRPRLPSFGGQEPNTFNFNQRPRPPPTTGRPFVRPPLPTLPFATPQPPRPRPSQQPLGPGQRDEEEEEEELDNLIPFEASDAIIIPTTPQTTPAFTPPRGTTPPSTVNDNVLLEADLENFISAVSEEDTSGSQVFDSRVNSINVVEATVVEDFDYARRVRDSAGGGGSPTGEDPSSSIGIATISSITIGLIAMLVFSLLIFLAVARNRRRRRLLSETGTGASSLLYDTYTSTTTPTPSPSRTTASVMGGVAPTEASTTASNNSAVLPLDGHQTIVNTYNEFLAAPDAVDITNSLPPPPSISPSSMDAVPRTKNLHEADLLFSRDIHPV